MTIIEYTHTATDTTARCIGSLTIVRDYETEESVDDDSPNLVAEASNAGKQLFETIQRAEQNTELVNFREKRAESQQVENKYLDVLEHEF
ncbi:hypothetical protein [Haladaptatus halobius]|uniref:hypothetical protein n=1 Tax=Haladaptatus halobius TaxID=2884875 RepID=UPI001D0B07B5|nr:hypothetical protein [Haladaptatus halobius]